ncbi:DUF5342 family protein [Sporosarcina sp. YIM B06819]|uniref:DUF5342 family protein n=1 Tax=Sporosarcina sp. YIM B06819 TaxID=3081769 RepID=UPI00298C06E8|nr:DUF5342 family protein [Sporosarcina sp. YIM B06819]
MLNTFHIKKALFQNQIHERLSFSVNYKGNDYQGLYHEGVINWFNPQPFNKIGAKQLKQIESNITDKMHKHLTLSF